MKKADYREIAEFYDRGRSLSEQNMDLWLDLISRYSEKDAGARVLDLGCGTGRFSIPMANKLHYRLTGADSSREMLAQAKKKDSRGIIDWDCVDAQNLKYPDASFDIVFMSHLLHHVDSPAIVITECKRVLKNRGVILVRYGAIEQIRDDVEHTFFPETLPIDEFRTPCIKTVENWLSSAGFSNIKTEEVVQRTYESGDSHLNAITVKATSVLTMLSPESYRQGIQKLSKYIEENADDSWLLHDRLSLTAGYKH
jgi:ubiquinone/menaquinone biosynthesis C-methylase UbiE